MTNFPCKKRKRLQGCSHTEKRPQEDTAGSQPSANQRERERPQKKPDLWAP